MLKPYVLPLALVVLVTLFAVQRFGTAKIGRAFGPVMLVWFVVIGVIGLTGVIRHPVVLEAIDPRYGLRPAALHRSGRLGAAWRSVPVRHRR